MFLNKEPAVKQLKKYAAHCNTKNKDIAIWPRLKASKWISRIVAKNPNENNKVTFIIRVKNIFYIIITGLEIRWLLFMLADLIEYSLNVPSIFQANGE